MTRPLDVLPFEAPHAEALRLRPEAAFVLGRLAAQADGIAQLARGYAAAGPAWTLMAADGPVACGGAVLFWPGVGELWCWLGREADGWDVSLARAARRRVDALFQGHGLRRAQAHVRADDERAMRFARFLGLGLEGRCPGYGPDGAEHHLYGRVVQWKV